MVLKSYEQFSATGWEIVLENVKERVKGKIAGNALYINKIKDYFGKQVPKPLLSAFNELLTSTCRNVSVLLTIIKLR